MPALSPTMTEGTLTKWFIKVGDDIKAGEIIAEIETDKATMEVEAVDEGKVTKILVEESDEPIQVNMGVRRIEGAQSGKHIEEGSHVRSRVVSKAINQNDPRASKIGLNCKMDGLGAADWLKETD